MTDLTQLESLARDVIAGVQHLRRTGREHPAGAHAWSEEAAEHLRRALLLVDELQAEIPGDLTPGTVVNILPRPDGTNYTYHDGWTVVGPSRHSYLVVVREPEYGTTVEVERERVEAAR